MLKDDKTSSTESVGARMIEFGISCGSSMKGCLRGRIGRVYNQHVTRIICTYTLRHVLREQSSYEIVQSARYQQQ